MKKKRISAKNMLILLGLLVVLLGAALPHFAWVVERAMGGAGLSTLVQVNVAENDYFLTHHVFTTDWQKLDKRLPPNLPGKFLPVSVITQERFFQVDGSKEGFSFQLNLADDLKSGSVTARKGGLISYTLKEQFPFPQFSCAGNNFAGRWFCKKFLVYTSEIMFKPQEKNATSPSENQPEKNRP